MKVSRIVQPDNRKVDSAMIQAVEMSKRYENGLLGLDVLNLKVYAGEIYCLLGENGAGKTTAINLFLDLIQPTSGHAFINGVDIHKNPIEAKKNVAYVSENVMLYGNLTARQNLEFFTRLRFRQGLRRDDYYMVLREVGLQERTFEQRVKKFSKGMRQKVSIAIAITANAPAILLDEPTAGLDAKAAAEFMETLSELRAGGKAILMFDS